MKPEILTENRDRRISLTLPLYRVHNLIALIGRTVNEGSYDVPVLMNLEESKDIIMAQIIGQFPEYADCIAALASQNLSKSLGVPLTAMDVVVISNKEDEEYSDIFDNEEENNY